MRKGGARASEEGVRKRVSGVIGVLRCIMYLSLLPARWRASEAAEPMHDWHRVIDVVTQNNE